MQRLATKLELWWDFGLKFGAVWTLEGTSEPKGAGAGLHAWKSEVGAAQDTRGDLSLVTCHLI